MSELPEIHDLKDKIDSALFLGQDMKFWSAVCIGVGIKWLFSPRPSSRKEAVGGIVAGAVAAYYGTDLVLRSFVSLSGNDRDLVIIALVLTGEHFVRGLMAHAPGIVDTIAKKKGPEE